MIKIKVIGFFREYVGRKYFSFFINQKITVRELLGKLSPELKKYIEENLDNSIILVNDVSIFNLNSLDTVLKDEDEISIMPVVGGG